MERDENMGGQPEMGPAICLCENIEIGKEILQQRLNSLKVQETLLKQKRTSSR